MMDKIVFGYVLTGLLVLLMPLVSGEQVVELVDRSNDTGDDVVPEKYIVAQSGGGQAISGGGIIEPTKYTYNECNELLKNRLEGYENAAKRANKIANLLWIVFIIICALGLVWVGMSLQKEKDEKPKAKKEK